MQEDYFHVCLKMKKIIIALFFVIVMVICSLGFLNSQEDTDVVNTQDVIVWSFVGDTEKDNETENIIGKDEEYLESKTVKEEGLVKDDNIYFSWNEYEKLKLSELEDQLYYRGLYPKYKYQLDELITEYPEKIDRINAYIEELREQEVKEDGERMTELKNKIIRLKDKYALVILEKESREKELFDRTPSGTVYYIDYSNGDDAANGLGTGTAWKTTRKYTTVTVRSDGDIAYVRACSDCTDNVTLTNVEFDEDASSTAPHFIIGATADTEDPWSDASDRRPIIDFRDTNYNLNLAFDYWWYFENLEFRNSTDSLGIIYVSASQGFIIKNCRFEVGSVVGKAGTEELTITTDTQALVYNSYFGKLNSAGGLSVINGAQAYVKDCVFNTSRDGTSYGVYVSEGKAYVRDSNFTDTDYAFYIHYNGKIVARNINISDDVGTYFNDNFGEIYIEGINGDINTTYNYHWDSTLERETTNVRTGGSEVSGKLQPYPSVGNYSRASLTHDSFVEGDFKIWVPANQVTNITVYVKGYNWATFPKANELYLESYYLGSADTTDTDRDTRTRVVSDEVLDDNTDWIGFDTIVNPTIDGWVYTSLFIELYEDLTTGVYVDLKPLINGT